MQSPLLFWAILWYLAFFFILIVYYGDGMTNSNNFSFSVGAHQAGTLSKV